MTTYGFAIKALPQRGKPFGDDDEDQEQDAPAEGAEPGAHSGGTDLSEEPAAAAPTSEDLTSEEAPDEDAAQPGDNAEVPDDGAGAPGPGPDDDSRPWSGDPYDEGDETDPSAAFAAYRGADGEEAWLDQASDGTLTGWVRDVTGQVWQYTDPDVWAIDVDDAQMTRTHSQAGGDDGAASGEHGGQDALFPPQQS